MKVRRQHDVFWKAILEEVFGDMLRFVFPGAEAIFDFERGFAFLEQELRELRTSALQGEKKAEVRVVDKLAKVYLKGQEEWVLVHVEVQERCDAFFASRVFQYYWRIVNRFNRQTTSLAIVTHGDGSGLESTYERSFLESELKFKCKTLVLGDYRDEELVADENPFALVMLIARQALIAGRDRDEKLLQNKLFVFRILLEKGVMKSNKFFQIFSFLVGYEPFESRKNRLKFVGEVNKLTKQKEAMSVFEVCKKVMEDHARVEGRLEERERTVKKLLKSGKFDEAAIAEMLGFSLKFVSRMKKEM